MNIEDVNDIIYEKEENGICTITFNIPKKKNALSLVTFLEIETALADMEQDKNAKVLILTGCKEANAFSSGDNVDFKYLTSLPQEIKDPTSLKVRGEKLKMNLFILNILLFQKVHKTN